MNKKLKLDELDENQPSFVNLPTEVVERIFTNLPTKDLIRISCVCKKWYEISQLQKFRQKILLKIDTSKIDKNHRPEKIFQKSRRKFLNLYFGEQQKYSGIHHMWMTKILEDVENFKLENVELSYKELCLLLSKMGNLKTLSLFGCYLLTITPMELSDELLDSITRTMNNITCFESQVNSIGNYENLKQITQKLTKLEKFVAGFRKKSSGLYSEAIIETEILCSIIERNKSTLKELHIPTYQNKLPLSSVYQIENLNLNYLNVEYDYYSPPATLSLDQFLQAHKNITILIVSVKSYKKLNLELLAKNMHSLQQLEISAERKNIHNLNLMTISKFKNLKILKLLKSPAPSFSSNEIANNLILKELYIQNMDLTETDIINISEKLGNLETLTLQSVPLTDSGLQAIIKNLCKLKYLNLENTRLGSSQVTEYGISGFDLITNTESGKPIHNLKNLEFLQLWGIQTLSDTCLVNNFKFEKIRKINICNSDGKSNLTLEILNDLFKSCPKLEEFILTN